MFVFEERKEKKVVKDPLSLPCPLCGKKILKGKAAYGCAGYKEGCAFRLPFIKEGKELTDKEAYDAIVKMKEH